MLFSIVIPVYNVEKYLKECLDSILQQVNSIDNDCEILLIDDGSTDKSSKICDMYNINYPDLIKVFHKKNEGLLATRRYGYKIASGKYIINCDSDDLLESNMLIKLKTNIEKYNEPDVLLFNYNYLVNNEKLIACNNIFTESQNSIIDKNSVLEMYLKNHKVVSLCTKSYKKMCIDIDKDYTCFYNVSNGEDSLQSIEVYNNADTFVYLNDELYDYRIGSGMTRKFDKDYYLGFKVILDQIKQQENNWNLIDFNNLFAIKVMQIAGRAITQSRYNNWDSYSEHRIYLKSIKEDKYVNESLNYLASIKGYLQKDHFYLLLLLKYGLYLSLCILLYLKNKLD